MGNLSPSTEWHREVAKDKRLTHAQRQIGGTVFARFSARTGAPFYAALSTIVELSGCGRHGPTMRRPLRRARVAHRLVGTDAEVGEPVRADLPR